MENEHGSMWYLIEYIKHDRKVPDAVAGLIAYNIMDSLDDAISAHLDESEDEIDG